MASKPQATKTAVTTTAIVPATVAAQPATVTPTAQLATNLQPTCAICHKPISPLNTTGIGHTCTKHAGKVGLFYQAATTNPQGNPAFMPLTALCNLSQTLGKSRGYAVKLTGGDAGCRAPVSPVFTVTTYMGRKYVSANAAQALTTLVKTGKLP